jgi:DNA (cytosine-5)-methyltransferase 1
VNELALFAGAGGGILGGKLLGWRTVCAVECDAYAASVLVARQNDGILEAFPVWDDVRTFDGRSWRGIVDLVSGGFPCQDISCAGKGDGLDGERSGLWREFARILGEVRPRYAFIENSPALTIRGGLRVIADLTALGYDCRWGIVSAADAGAPHLRKRIWIVADADTGRCEIERQQEYGIEQGASRYQLNGCGQGRSRKGENREMEHTNGKGCQHAQESNARSGKQSERAGDHRAAASPSWWNLEPDVGRVADGTPFRVDKLRALGNAQVPAVAALAWRILSNFTVPQRSAFLGSVENSSHERCRRSPKIRTKILQNSMF